MSAVETGQMSAAGTGQMSSVARTDIWLVSAHNVQVSETSTVAMSQCSSLRSLNCGNVTVFKSQKSQLFKSQIGGLALNHQKCSEMAPEWSPGPENWSPGFSRPFSRLWDRSRDPKPPKYTPNSQSTAHGGRYVSRLPGLGGPPILSAQAGAIVMPVLVLSLPRHEPRRWLGKLLRHTFLRARRLLA